MKLNKMVLTILGAAILSLIICYAFFKMFHALYGKEIMTRLDPVYGQTHLHLESTKYLFIGDSRIAQWTIPDSIITPDNLLNLGIDAQTSAQVLYRARDFLLNTILITHLSKLVLMI